jgi:hypothetical protein
MIPMARFHYLYGMSCACFVPSLSTMWYTTLPYLQVRNTPTSWIPPAHYCKSYSAIGWNNMINTQSVIIQMYNILHSHMHIQTWLRGHGEKVLQRAWLRSMCPCHSREWVHIINSRWLSLTPWICLHRLVADNPCGLAWWFTYATHTGQTSLQGNEAIYMYVCIYVRACVRMWACMYVCVYAFAYAVTG